MLFGRIVDKDIQPAELLHRLRDDLAAEGRIADIAGKFDALAFPMPDDIAIVSPLVIAVATIFGTIIIHALAVIAVVHFVRYERKLRRAAVRFWRGVAVVSEATLVALAAHLVEMMAWAVVFVACGEFSSLAAAFYHSAVNYTSSPIKNSEFDIGTGAMRTGVTRANVFAAGAIALLAFAWPGAVRTQPATSTAGLENPYWSVLSDTFGTKVDYPENIFSVGAGPAVRGTGRTLRSLDDRAWLMIYVEGNEERHTPASFVRA